VSDVDAAGTRSGLLVLLLRLNAAADRSCRYIYGTFPHETPPLTHASIVKSTAVRGGISEEVSLTFLTNGKVRCWWWWCWWWC